MAEAKFNSGKKPHLSKDQRVPRCYKEVEKILRSVKSCQGSIKTVMYNSRLRGAIFNKVYALSINILKYRHLLDKVIEETEILQKEPILRKELTGIMIYELLFGKGLPGESKPVMIINKYQEDIEKVYRKCLLTDSLNLPELCTIPKYVRVNTLVTSVSDILKDLEQWDYQEIKVESSANFDQYLDLVKNLKTGCYLVDYHFKDLLVFAHDENLSTWPLYKKKHVFIQDKSSYIPVHVLDPVPGSTVIDACAAPGMKTVHIAAVMKNQGKIYAFEKDGKRFKVLQEMMESANIKICSSACNDFYKVDCFDPKFEAVEYILVDPTCSGSGMVSRMDNVTDTEESKNDSRIKKLAGFQILLLKHALAFPNVKRVVYSTCSITEDENEFVVHEVLNHFRYYFKLSLVMPDWPIRGSDNFEFGNLCVRAYPEKSLTNGFFVAMFERMSSEEQEQYKFANFALEKPLLSSKNIKIQEEEEHQCEDSQFATEKSFSNSHKLKQRKSKNRFSSSEFKEEQKLSQENPDLTNNLPSNFSKLKKKKFEKFKLKSKSTEIMEQDCVGSHFPFENAVNDFQKSKSENKTEMSGLLEQENEQMSTDFVNKNSPIGPNCSSTVKSEKTMKFKSQGKEKQMNENLSALNFISDSSDSKNTKSKKHKRKSDVDVPKEQPFKYLDFTLESSDFKNRKSKLEEVKSEFPETLDELLQEDSESSESSVENMGTLIDMNSFCDLSDRKVCAGNVQMYKGKIEKPEQNYSVMDMDFTEGIELSFKPCLPPPIFSDVKQLMRKKKRKKKQHDSESIKSEICVNENGILENEIQYNVSQDSFILNGNEDFEEEPQKKKHKKCKDKKYKGE